MVERINADAGVPDFNHLIGSARAHGQQNAAALGVADGIGHQIAQNHQQQRRIAMHGIKAVAAAIDQAFVVGLWAELVFELAQQTCQWHAGGFGLHHASLNARKIQQCVEQLAAGAARRLGVRDNRFLLGVQKGEAERLQKKVERMHRLAQIMTGTCQKFAFGYIGLFGGMGALVQLLNERDIFKAQLNRTADFAFNIVGKNAVAAQ